jgi:hypothetical protein
MMTITRIVIPPYGFESGAGPPLDLDRLILTFYINVERGRAKSTTLLLILERKPRRTQKRKRTGLEKTVVL